MDQKKHPLKKYTLSGALFFLIIFPALLMCQPGTQTSGNQGCKYVEDGFGPDGEVDVKAETVVSGLEVPWAIAFLPGGDLLVTERPGRIRIVRDYNNNPTLVPEPLATFETASTSEGGLLGIALHPDFSSNRLFYVYVTVENGGDQINQIEQWELSENRLSAERVKIIYDEIEAASNHNGGRIAFGPDGMLYAGTGDAQNPDSSQDPESPNGKLLRISPEGEIPSDNPVKGNPMFIMGIRNTEGWAWPDPDDANLVWLMDHGPSGEMLRFGHDELNVARVNDNLGWPTIYRCENQSGLKPPELTWKEAVPPGGAAVYTGDIISEWKGDLIVGTLGSRHLQRVVINNGSVSSHEVYFRNELGRLREVVISPEGDLFITTSNCDGRGSCPDEKDKILRITK